MHEALDRRAALGLIGLAGAGVATGASAATIALPFANGARPTSSAFPGKGELIVQRVRAPLLETPLTAMDGNVFTPNNLFFVRWHYDAIPTSIDTRTFRLKVTGAVRRPLAISLDQFARLPRFRIAAVNQCSGNSRGHFAPRVPGAQWSHGAIGNAVWEGVRLRDVLDLAGVRGDAVAVRFAGLDRPPPGAPWYAKALTLDHARDGEVMIATHMNGAALPMLNGFPMRLVVPGWFSTYWIKALDRIEVLTAPDAGYWMAKAYQIPASRDASVAPDTADFLKVPINRMVPRALFTSHGEAAQVVADQPYYVRGLAMGGASGVARVDLSMDGGQSWKRAHLGPDQGRYGFRLWEATLPGLRRGGYRLWARATNADGQAQAMRPIWNPGGYMYNPCPSIAVRAA